MLNNASAVFKVKAPMSRILRGLTVAAFGVASLVGLASCASMTEFSGETGSQVDRVGDGRRFASLRCATCHAMDGDQFSPNADAPPMSRLSPRLEFKMLERTPEQKFGMAHGTMPPLDSSMLDKDALVAYLDSIAD